jgi:hypothetical protein
MSRAVTAAAGGKHRTPLLLPHCIARCRCRRHVQAATISFNHGRGTRLVEWIRRRSSFFSVCCKEDAVGDCDAQRHRSPEDQLNLEEFHGEDAHIVKFVIHLVNNFVFVHCAML